MKKLFLFLFLFYTFTINYGQDFITINEEKIHYEIKGTGEPWIIMVTGIGRDLNDLDSIYNDLSKETTVLRYSRAGLGKSTFNNKGADFDETVDELTKLIEKLNGPDPFILSGHSYGGLIIRSYTTQNTSRVAGLMSLDPNFEDYFEVLEPLNPRTRDIIKSLLDDFIRDFPDSANGSELEATIEVWNSPEKWNEWFDCPSTVPHFLISSLKVTNSQLKGTQALVDARYKAQQRTVKNSEVHMVLGLTDTGHSVYSDQPQLVIDAFKMLINAVKTANTR